MALFKYQCVYFGLQGAGYTRQNRNPSSYAGFFPLNSNKNDSGHNHYQPNTPFALQPIQYPDAQIMQNGKTYDFSFVNISGFTSGGATSFDRNNPPSGVVSADPTATLLVLAVYIPEGGPGPNGDPGAVIDAFDETSGTLFNNYFVGVTPDSGGTRTNTANVYGYVDTVSQAATITADSFINNVQPASITPPYVQFEAWHVLSGAASSASGVNLNVGAGVTEYALAFYKGVSSGKGWILDKPKDQILDGVKQIGDTIIRDPEGPIEIISELSKISAGVSRIQTELGELKGKSFIQSKDRPDVGGAIARGEE